MNNQQYIYTILDESSSMFVSTGLVKRFLLDIIKPYDETLRFSPCHSIYTFSNECRCIISNESNISPSRIKYYPCGCTALYDSIYTALNDFVKYTKISNIIKPRIILNVITDGVDNMSKHTPEQIVAFVDLMKSIDIDVTLYYYSTRIDGHKIASKLNIDDCNIVNFYGDEHGYKTLSEIQRSYTISNAFKDTNPELAMCQHLKSQDLALNENKRSAMLYKF